MIDVTIIGSGQHARLAGELLKRAGFRLKHGLELESGDHSPIILGEISGAFGIAHQAVQAGRHVLVANPGSFSPDWLEKLLEPRRSSQAIFFWSERRAHPGYRFVTSLMETDSTWRPRYVRQDCLSTEQTNAGAIRSETLESLALTISIAGEAPIEVSARGSRNAYRNACDVVSLHVTFPDMESFSTVSLGEAIDRRETLIAAPQRKAFIDELNQSTPIRLVEDDPDPRAQAAARWISCPSPTPEELARGQCLGFLDATLKNNLARDEAEVWQRSLSAFEAMEQSLEVGGAAVPVALRQPASKFKLIAGRAFSPSRVPPSIA